MIIEKLIIENYRNFRSFVVKMGTSYIAPVKKKVDSDKL